MYWLDKHQVWQWCHWYTSTPEYCLRLVLAIDCSQCGPVINGTINTRTVVMVMKYDSNSQWPPNGYAWWPLNCSSLYGIYGSYLPRECVSTIMMGMQLCVIRHIQHIKGQGWFFRGDKAYHVYIFYFQICCVFNLYQIRTSFTRKHPRIGDMQLLSLICNRALINAESLGRSWHKRCEGDPCHRLMWFCIFGVIHVT